jgi:hypothetical protein
MARGRDVDGSRDVDRSRDVESTSSGDAGTGTERAETAAMEEFLLVAGLAAVLFVGGLALTEPLGEIPPDIDFKPFFLVYALVALLPRGLPTVAAALGAAVGEGVLDLVEGYEVDDPFGFVGYVLGFTLAGRFMDDPDDFTRVAVGAVLGAFLQATTEGLALWLLGGESVVGATTSVLANTVTHGVIMGVIPLVPALVALRGRVERYLTFVRAPDG